MAQLFSCEIDVRAQLEKWQKKKNFNKLIILISKRLDTTIKEESQLKASHLFLISIIKFIPKVR